MAYYCKKCGCYHYYPSAVWWAHKAYSSFRHSLKKVVRRKTPRNWRW